MNRPPIRTRGSTRRATARSRIWPIWAHALVENRNGLIAAALVTQADGYAEREAALLMLQDQQKGCKRRITVGADKAYDTKDFIAATRALNVKLTDPRHNDMAAEIAKLQKDNGVNMFGGCVPLLIQMPLLFAFFGMLRKAVALRGAEWLWLHDLSSADPYHILPILMVVFQLLVQLYTPSPGSDATQQKMVACLMTVGFGFVSWHYASGLALYALTGSLLSIATQAAMNRSALGRELKTLRTSDGG